jgi:hypothetical protein
MNMQTTPPLDSSRITYQVPHDVLVRILWRRMMFRSRNLSILGVCILLAVVCFIMGGGAEIAAYVFLGFAIANPIGIYGAINKSVGNNSEMTDLKTVDFNSSGLVATGPNWRHEMPWTRFRGFSEDDSYFYLHLSDSGTASIVPKSAFTAEQQQKFRGYAQARNA